MDNSYLLSRLLQILPHLLGNKGSYYYLLKLTIHPFVCRQRHISAFDALQHQQNTTIPNSHCMKKDIVKWTDSFPSLLKVKVQSLLVRYSKQFGYI